MEDYKVGLYLRLSRDDKNSDSESMSISNQRTMLMDFTAERGLHVEDIYIDDGISGTTFERPSFKRMVADIEKKRINMVVVKDLSRLGRNYVKVGEYTDFFFPQHDVRFIAVAENIDSDNENDVSGFLNVVNEHYAKDISRKIRASQKSLMKKGFFLGSQPPLGYVKSPEDKHKLIVDEDGAAIVRRWFHMYAIGHTARHIANTFNQVSMVMWYVIDRFKPLWVDLSFGKYITIGISAILGFALAFGFGLDLVNAVGLFNAITPMLKSSFQYFSTNGTMKYIRSLIMKRKSLLFLVSR